MAINRDKIWPAEVCGVRLRMPRWTKAERRAGAKAVADYHSTLRDEAMGRIQAKRQLAKVRFDRIKAKREKQAELAATA
jgi:hypothetical protein